MFSINEYQSLKINGTWRDRLQYVLSIPNKDSIENYLKESLFSSYDDLKMLIFLSVSSKNDKNLMEIFKNDSLPIHQRISAGQYWIKFQKDEKQIHNLLVEVINDKNIARYLKHQILKVLPRIKLLKKSNSFFYDLICDLTKYNNHDQYNIDGHLVPCCKKEQIINLLSQWSLKRFEQIDCLSSFYFKLIRYQPLIVLRLIKEDLDALKTNDEKFSDYFQKNEKLFNLLAKKIPKELINLTIEYLNQLEKHKRFLPQFIQSQEKYFFKKVPDRMIQLITIVAINKPGKIKYMTRWSQEGYELNSLSLPTSFSIENYINLFFSLYDTCQWSSNNTLQIFKYLLENRNSNIYSLKKERKWLIDTVIEERIGKELFLEKFLKEANENYLDLFSNYPELTTFLSFHLISEYERNGIIQDKKRLSLIRYQLMTQDLFDQFLSLFKKTSSDFHQRQENYLLFIQCAISSNNNLFIKNVLEFIQKRFTNEQIIVIEYFLRQLSSLNRRFHIEFLPNYFDLIESIINIAMNHLQQSRNTLEIIISYGIFLLKIIENCQNKQKKEKLQEFAMKIIKRCYTKNDSLTITSSSIDESYQEANKIFADILLSDLYPKLIHKSMLDELNDSLSSFTIKIWRLPQIDSFLNLFFTEHLCSSTKIQSSFDIDQHSSLISFFLKNKSTQLERINQLINNINKIFFVNTNVQRIALRSQQYRQFIDELIQDEKCLTIDKLLNETSDFRLIKNSETKNLKLPGLNIEVLNSCYCLLTGKQQQTITKIILNDYLQDNDISNVDKLKSLRVLRRLSDTYNETVEWINKKQGSALTTNNTNETTSGRTRGAAVQPIDTIVLCLPARFDITSENLYKHLDLLKNNLNTSNAKFISDAILNISRKINDDIFLKFYIEFISDEKFPKLGITANKEILRLLIEFVSNSSLIKTVVKPLWDNHPHQDVRACLILTLLHFIDKINPNNDDNDIIIWKILEQAADDEYLPVVQSLFAAHRGESRWPLSKLKYSSNNLFETFVNRIQFKILDHPTSLEARSWAWANVEYEHCQTSVLIEKAHLLCIQFDKNADNLWETAFEKIILSYKQQKISSIDKVIDIIKKMMSYREEIDSKENAIDKQHDLPVYHRIQHLLKNLTSHIDQFNNEEKISFRLLIPIIFQFDKTFAPFIGKLLIKLSQTKEDIEDGLKMLEENLPESYFERILIDLSIFINKTDSCPFIQQLNVDDKLNLAKWFMEEKNRPLFIFDLLKNHVFNQSGVDQQQCQNMIRNLRQSKNLFLQEQALTYIVPWKNDQLVSDDDSDHDITD
ncbi:unnamed protein product [Rotaria socialis]|uniref:Uncharacterized protein n=1 Tax=Rotaria socialis TaxID=392032 RepID=A0A817T3Y7_9BILA|nr:unnamed protein product [Rotaria socialis]CAF4572666.1 unnamed protein product [Rotaria socialis]